MKILLVNPIIEFFAEALYTDFPYMPIGILYLAAVAEKLGHKVIVKNIHSSNFKKLIKMVKPDLVGITCSTPQYNQAVKIAKIAKNYNGETTTIIGGYHPTVMWRQILSETNVFDYICIREGEETFKEFLENFNEREKLKNVAGLAYKENNQAIFTGERELISDLDSLPFPDRDLVEPKRVASILMSRGCPYNCKFCAIKNFYKHGLRRRSIKNIMEEISLLRDRGYKHIRNGDANFGTDKEYVLEFCKEIEKLNLRDTTFLIDVDMRTLTDDFILESLEKTNIQFILEVGIQSVIDEFRNHFNLFGNQEFVKEFFRKIKKYDFHVRCWFIVNSGKEGESVQIIKNNIEAVCRLLSENSDGRAKFFPYFLILVPYPGTEVEKDFIKRQIKLESNWSLYRPEFCVYEHNDVNKEFLEGALEDLGKKFSPDQKRKNEKILFIQSAFLADISWITKVKIFFDFLFLQFFGRKKAYQSWRIICAKYF